MSNIKTPKKLIEVALPLDDINIACAKEKSIRQGHPSTLHLWWARRPLAAARSVIFAQMVNDPGGNRGYGPGMTKAQAQIERERLFTIIRKLVLWENTNNEEVLAEARVEIWKSWRETCELNKSHPDAASLFNPEKLPAFHDPFAGGGAIPLEAQRLGLESYASDLNPVAVMINKAMIEIPPKFSGQKPVGPLPPAISKKDATTNAFEDWSGAKGLAEDVRRYGYWIREEAFKRLNHLYPLVDLVTGKPISHDAGKQANAANIIAWIWARTVKSPNPAFSHIDVPLVSSFILSSNKGKEAWVEPIINGDQYKFNIKFGSPSKTASNGTKVGRGGHFKCLISGSPIHVNEIREQGKAGKIGQRLLAVVAEGKNGRCYISPTDEMEALANSAVPTWKPDTEINHNPRDIRTQLYGLTKYGDLFTPRQLVGLVTFCDLIQDIRSKIREDALSAGMNDDGQGLDQGGSGATSYADAVAVYLAFGLQKSADYNSSICSWISGGQTMRNTFGRQAIPMVWDFAEANIVGTSTGSYSSAIDQITRVLGNFSAYQQGTSIQHDAQSQNISINKLISTDPPYYDNIGYADLSDFFYVWLRRSLRPVFPSLFATMAVPKAEELVATPYRHGTKEDAERFFLDGMTEAMQCLAENAHPTFPTTIYYAFKQSDTTDVGTGNTGWETFLEAVLRAGFAITGTWPMRTEMANRMVSSGTNAATISRREFIRELKEELTEAIEVMIGGAEGISPVAPVDLAQAVIGPGMAIFSKYAAVLEADGNPMSVHDALVLINRTVTEGGDDFDADTQFALSWFDEQGWSEGEFGKADVLARAKGTSVAGVADAGVLETGAGKVRLLKWAQYPEDWSPEHDNRTPVWEALHQLIRVLNQHGESAAGNLVSRMPERSAAIRQLAYRLYTLCERKGWAEDARAYNELIGSWTAIIAASLDVGHKGEQFGLDQFAE